MKVGLTNIEAAATNPTLMVFEEAGAPGPASPREKQVRFKGFHDAYRCVARMAEARGDNEFASLLLLHASDVKSTALTKLVGANWASDAMGIVALIYIVYPTHCPRVRKGALCDAIAVKFHHKSAQEAWRSYAAELSSLECDPADFLVVVGETTGEIDSNGAHVVSIDWVTARPAVVVMQEPHA